MHQNIQGALSKLDFIEITLNEMLNSGKRIDVLCLSESFLKKGDENNLKICNFKLASSFSRCKQKRGGSCILVKKNLYFKQLQICKDLSIEKVFECCGVEIPDHNLVVINIYRVPKYIYEKQFLLFLEALLYNLSKNKKGRKIVISGDWNFNILKQDKNTVELLALLNNYNLKTHINVPTRGQSCLDQIASNLRSATSFVLPLALSDHETAQFISFNIKKTDKSRLNYIQKRDYSLENLQKFKYYMESLSFSDILSINDSNKAFCEFHGLLSLFNDLCFPYIKVKLKHKHCNNRWMTKGLRLSCIRKKKLYLKYLHEASNKLVNQCKYKRYTRLLKRCVFKARQLYNRKFIALAKSKSKATWQIVNGHKNFELSNIDYIEHNKIKYFEPSDIAELMNNFFIDIANNTTYKNLDINYSNSISFNPKTIFLNPLSSEEITKIILSLKNSNATGTDGISTKIIKLCAQHFAKPLAHIINLSLVEGRFPATLKCTIVRPLFKKGDTACMDDYRPIANIPIMSKIFERAMYSRLLSFLNVNSVLNNDQYGFRKGSSTTLACFNLMKIITDSMNKKQHVAAIFLDLSKAFDFVDHSILLNKLNKYGIRGKAYEWINSYLSDRQQCTEIHSIRNGELEIVRSVCKYNRCGVPQGSILGPLLFLLYINDLPNCLNHKCVMFADDTTLIIKSENLDNYNNEINSALANVIDWLSNNNLKINVNKTYLMQFKTYKSQTYNLDVKCKNEKVVEVGITKFLGIHIDQFCGWKSHVSEICGKLHKFVFALRRLSTTCSRDVALTAYHGYVSSVLNYGLLVWGNSVDVEKAFLAQKKCIRAVCNSHFLAPCRPLFKTTRVLPLPCMYIKQISLFVKDHPDYFISYSQIYTRSTRCKKKLYQPLAKSNVFKRNSFYMAIKIYNNLPTSIQECPRKQFCKVLTRWLLDKCYYSLHDFFNDQDNKAIKINCLY